MQKKYKFHIEYIESMIRNLESLMKSYKNKKLKKLFEQNIKNLVVLRTQVIKNIPVEPLIPIEVSDDQ